MRRSVRLALVFLSLLALLSPARVAASSPVGAGEAVAVSRPYCLH